MTIRENVKNKQDWEHAIASGVTRKVNVHKFNQDKITVCPIGDTHAGSKDFAEEELDSVLNWCLENESPVILMGDLMETATRDSVGAGVYDQNKIVQEQLDQEVERYKPLADAGLILGSHSGNHEARVYKSTGLDLAAIFAKMIDVPYLGVGAAWTFRVGNQSYTMYTTHGSSGARMPHTKIANVIKMNQMIDADIYAQGHLHQLSHHVQNFYAIDKSRRQVMEQQKHYILTGAFLKHWGSYAHVSNMEPARIGSPKVKLGGLEKSIRVSLG